MHTPAVSEFGCSDDGSKGRILLSNDADPSDIDITERLRVPEFCVCRFRSDWRSAITIWTERRFQPDQVHALGVQTPHHVEVATSEQSAVLGVERRHPQSLWHRRHTRYP